MNERELACISYFLRVEKRLSGLRRDSFNKQFFAEGLREIWSSFDGCLSWKFPDKTPRKMRRKLCSIYQPVFENWAMSDTFKDSLNRLQKLCPVIDMRPVKPEQPISINNPKNLFEILEVSYRVRSNLDHGGKDLESDTQEATRNRELVEFSLRVTHEILRKVLTREGILK